MTGLLALRSVKPSTPGEDWQSGVYLDAVRCGRNEVPFIPSAAGVVNSVNVITVLTASGAPAWKPVIVTLSRRT